MALLSFSQYRETAFLLQDPSSGTYFRDNQDPFSTGVNPAAMARFSRPVFALLGENRYGSKGINQMMLSMAYPLANGCWATQLDYYGFSSYSQTQLSIAYARTVGAGMDIGLRFHYFHLHIPGFKNLSTIYSHIGFRYSLNSQVIIGWSAANPFGRIRISGGNELLPAVYSAGIGYTMSAQTGVAIHLVKESGRPPAIIAAFRYRPIEVLSFKMGANSSTRQPFFSIQLQKKSWLSLWGVAWHSQLGFSPYVGWQYYFSKKGSQ